MPLIYVVENCVMGRHLAIYMADLVMPRDSKKETIHRLVYLISIEVR